MKLSAKLFAALFVLAFVFALFPACGEPASPVSGISEDSAESGGVRLREGVWLMSADNIPFACCYVPSGGRTFKLVDFDSDNETDFTISPDGSIPFFADKSGKLELLDQDHAIISSDTAGDVLEPSLVYFCEGTPESVSFYKNKQLSGFAVGYFVSQNEYTEPTMNVSYHPNEDCSLTLTFLNGDEVCAVYTIERTTGTGTNDLTHEEVDFTLYATPEENITWQT